MGGAQGRDRISLWQKLVADATRVAGVADAAEDGRVVQLLVIVQLVRPGTPARVIVAEQA